MAKASYIRQPTVQRITSLLEEVRDGVLRVPRFQRPPVWSDRDRLSLLESIHQGIPIGSLLVWRTRAYPDLETYPLGPALEDEGEGDEEATDDPSRQYLLDGHQRVTTLFTILGWGLIDVEQRPTREQRRRNETYGTIRPIYYDLREEEFQLLPRGGAPDWWVPLDELFDDYALYELNERFGKLEDKRVLINRARSLHKRFYDYQVAIVPISTDELDIAVRSFERANRAGTRMSEAHMVSALVYASGLDVNDALSDIKQELDGWGELDEKVILTVCKAQLDLDLFSKQTRALVDRIKSDQSLLDQTQAALELALDFLREHCTVWGPNTLPYTHQLVLLADVLHRNRERPPSAELFAGLQRWFWQTTYAEYFASISSTRLRVTLEQLRDSAPSGSAKLPERYFNESVSAPRRFDFRSARSRALALMMADQEPQDERGRALQGPHELLALHGRQVMPKLFMARELRELAAGRDLSEGFENRFITTPGQTRELRRRLRDGDPEDEELLLSHGITLEAAALLREGSYLEFLERRRAFFMDEERSFVESLGLEYLEDQV